MHVFIHFIVLVQNIDLFLKPLITCVFAKRVKVCISPSWCGLLDMYANSHFKKSTYEHKKWNKVRKIKLPEKT